MLISHVWLVVTVVDKAAIAYRWRGGGTSEGRDLRSDPGSLFNSAL